MSSSEREVSPRRPPGSSSRMDGRADDGAHDDGFQIEVVDTWPGIAVVDVAGDVDLHSAPELREALSKLVDSDTTRQVTLDLSDVTFLDSMALGVILGAKKRLVAIRSRSGARGRESRHPADLRDHDARSDLRAPRQPRGGGDRGLQGGVDGGMNGKHRVDPCDLEDAQDARVRRDDVHPALRPGGRSRSRASVCPPSRGTCSQRDR